MFGKKGKVLITGGNGFLGTNAAKELYEQGYELKLMMRPFANVKALPDIPFEVYYGDISEANHVAAAVKGCDYVVHAASVTSQWGVDEQVYERVNVRGTKNIVKACLQHGVKKLVYISTANTIGPGNRSGASTELSSFSLSYLSSGYISSKYIAQQYVLEQAALRNLPAVVLNPTFMIGAGDVKPSSGQLILHGLNKRFVFYPPGGKNFVAVKDVCLAIARSLTLGRQGECYLLAGRNLSYGDFFRLLNEEKGQDPRMLRIPAFVLKIAGLAGSIAQLMGKKNVKLNYFAACTLCAYNYYSADKAVRELNMEFSPVSRAIGAALAWFKEHQYF
ncbi:NAD-dependent epimerase/dehydratase family protein [Pedobacter nutrimenti]|uniref:Dihydroflavonol-4-reductase n=1 Tax=Pedobacter nutrimenti TaxID=1241337 RepID=A0A318UD82_9SPHI|nr:NAD-dependent epimerase/dehydratase family protein [Pedobacter nutrimenti]PYF74043.1 dihydroflavonol-4-reductase [Pedobacter nutrimenti]